MRKFENQVQQVKHEVYKAVAQAMKEENPEVALLSIPDRLFPGPTSRYRCCVHHERAATKERVEMVLGGHPETYDLLEVLPSACDQCLENRYVVTEACRGCLAHRCVQSCPKDAIKIMNNRALIDQTKCIECGRCKEACPYNAIADVKRPCMKVCPADAITMDGHMQASIMEDQCVKCGACVYHCPFGAIADQSQMVPVMEALNNEDALYAIVAPAVATQFEEVTYEQVVTAIKKLGFKDVIEVALGADYVAIEEGKEFISRLEEGHKVMTSSCCPAFVGYIHKKYPSLVPYISHTPSPMVVTANLVKQIDPNGKVVFIGPCIAKKVEAKSAEAVDYVLVFEELMAMIATLSEPLSSLAPSPMNNASGLGRGFAASGGVSQALRHLVKDLAPDLDYETILCDGLKDCDKTLKLLAAGRLHRVFIEGMACEGGCIKGPVTMHYGPKDKKALASYCQTAHETSPYDAVKIFGF